MDKRRKEMKRMAKIYGEYLNGPFGKRVLGRLKEGESFTLQSKYKMLKVTKEGGKAIVSVEDRLTINRPSRELQI